MVELPTIIAIFAAIGVLAGATIAVFQLRNLVIQRKVNMVLSLVPSLKPDGGQNHNRMGRLVMTSEFSDYHDFIQRYGDLDAAELSEVANAFITLTNWYETLGLLYFNKMIDRNIFSEFFAFDTVGDWDKLKPIIVEIRQEKSEPKINEYFEYMAEDMRKNMRVAEPINPKSISG